MEFRMGVDMTEYHLVGIGNALVDVLAPVEDTFLEAHALDKGAMTLVDNERSAAPVGLRIRTAGSAEA